MYSATYNSKVLEATPRETRIQVVLADDYPVLLAGMRQSLALCDDITVVLEGTRLAALLPQVAFKKPDVVLLGWERTMDNLAQQLHSLADRHWDARVVVFT